jgi:hypothetical protein
VDYVAVWTRDGLGNGGDPQAGAGTTRRTPSYPAPVNAAPHQP